MATYIAVSPSVDSHRDGPRFRLNAAYANALDRSGLVPLIIPPVADFAMAEQLLEPVQGLLLTGGVDIDPSVYGQQRHPRTEPPSRTRDAWEIALFSVARERGLPTLAICRGLQLVNVAQGGTLVQDIASQRPGSLRHDRSSERTRRTHEVQIDAGTRLAQCTGAQRINVNSMHHQCIADPGADLKVVALAPDGVIEGMEWHSDDWWMLAVQWHPEELIADAESWDRNLFGAFAAAAQGATVR